MPNFNGHSFLEEKTEVLYDQNEIVRRVVEHCYNIKYTMDGCIDVNGSSAITIRDHPVTKAFVDMKRRGVRLRFISEITKDNLPNCRELMRIGEVRHLDEVKGNFGVLDGNEYHASATNTESGPPPQLIICTVKAVVDQQQYFFDMLWKKAIPAKQRIKEIEQGMKREFMETIQDPYETQKIFDNLIKSANEEIMITLPSKTTTTNMMPYQYEQKYLLHLLRDAADRGVKLRLLVDKSENQRIGMELAVTGTNSDLVEIQNFDIQQQNKIITAIVDNELCLTVEVKANDVYDESDSIDEVLGLAAYSNSESTVLSYASIFETLWMQAELRNRQNQVSSIP